MLPDQQILRIPGPTPIPPSVQQEMTKAMVGHRDKETKELIAQIEPKLKKVFGTKEDVFIISGSGTAGLETAVTNCVQPGDEVLVAVTGAFGDRFAKICEAYEIKTHRLEIEWGKAVTPEDLKNSLESAPNVKAVFITYCETSTGVLNPINELAQVVHNHSDALVIVDGVSCIGAVEAKMDDWGIDLLVTGSQKAMMLPPGLTFVAASSRAWKVIEQNKRPRFYFDLRKYQKQLELNSTPFTPAVSLLFGLKQVLNIMEDEGYQQIFARHRLMMNMTRAAFKAMEIPLLTSDEAASPTVTAIVPNNFQADDLRKILKEEFALTVAGGQQHLKGKVIRIGHMGYCSPAYVFQYISVMETALSKMDVPFEHGAGTKAAQKVYLA